MASSSGSVAVSPAILLSEAAATFLKAANHALSLSEEVNRIENDRAVTNERSAQTERDDSRAERDELLREKIALLRESQEAKREMERWKAATEKAEWTIDHQAETIAQLRREAQQWKEQFMRVEEERAKLSSRIDDIVSEQLLVNRRDTYFQEPLTPRSQGPQTGKSSTSQKYATTGTTSSASAMASGYESESDGKSKQPVTRQKQKQKAQQQRCQPKRGQPVPPDSVPESGSTHREWSSRAKADSGEDLQVQPHQTNFIRKVHAVITVPLKEEEDTGSEELLVEPMEETYSHRSRPSASAPPCDSDVEQPRRSKSGNRRSVVDEKKLPRRRRGMNVLDDYSVDSQEDEGSDEQQNSSDDDAKDPSYVPSTRVDDEEVDELMIGVEDNRSELYDSGRVLVTTNPTTPPRRAQTQASAAAKLTTTNGKRRVNSPHPATNTKRVRKR